MPSKYVQVLVNTALIVRSVLRRRGLMKGAGSASFLFADSRAPFIDTGLHVRDNEVAGQWC